MFLEVKSHVLQGFKRQFLANAFYFSKPVSLKKQLLKIQNVAWGGAVGSESAKKCPVFFERPLIKIAPNKTKLKMHLDDVIHVCTAKS